MSEHSLDDLSWLRYGRQLLLPEFGELGQQRLQGARVLIVGLGGLGSPVALYLAAAGVGRITVVDPDPERLRMLEDRLDLRGVAGNGIQPSVLRGAGAQDCDLFIACTPQDETNLVACKIAHDVFGIPTTIARLRSPEFSQGDKLLDKDGFSVDYVICPEESVTRTIHQLIEYPEALQVVKFSQSQAHLVVVNGLGFEGWINRLIKSSGYKGTVVVASKGSELLERRPAKATSQDKGHERHHHHGTRDPHAWQDVSNALRYVDTIAQALSSVDPEGRAHYMENARRYREELAALDTELKTAFQALPAERRSVVTPHDAFAYFARAYGLRFVAPRGVSNETEPSAADVARVIQLVKRENIPAVFVESITDARLIERIRQESGARVGGTLYSDALTGKDGPAPNYVAMMRHNATTLLAALRP